MSIYLRTVARRALLLSNNSAVPSLGVQKANLGTVAPEKKPRNDRYENNIVTSPLGDCELHYQPLHQRVFQSAAKWPNNVALECGITGRKYTYGMLAVLIRRFGSALTRMGFKKNEVFGIVAPNVPEFPIALHGASGAGMPVALVNPLYTPEEIARQMKAVNATAIFGVAPMADTLKEVARLCPSIRKVIVLGPPQEGTVSFQEMAADSGDLFNDNLDINAQDDLFILPHSSGTSGLPKNVMLTHHNIGANVSEFLQPGGTNHQYATGSYQEVYVCLLPFFHTYGITVIMMTGFETGAKLVTLPKLDIPSFFKALDDHKPTTLHVVPSLMNLITNYPGLKVESLQRLHTVFSGAAPLGLATPTKFLERLNNQQIDILEGYGLSETSPGCLMSPKNNAKLGSCGSPISRTLAKVVDPESNDGKGLGAYQHGEILVAGPQIMKGYWNNPKATADMIDSEGWLRTGDVGYYDDEGHFFVVDRIKELIKVKGFQVAPAELEEIISTHPAVADVAVIGIPDDQAGELPRAYIVKKPGQDSVSDAEIAKFVEDQVAPHKRVKGGVEFVAAIPKNNMGKILRREIRAAYASSRQQ